MTKLRLGPTERLLPPEDLFADCVRGMTAADLQIEKAQRRRLRRKVKHNLRRVRRICSNSMGAALMDAGIDIPTR